VAIGTKATLQSLFGGQFMEYALAHLSDDAEREGLKKDHTAVLDAIHGLLPQANGDSSTGTVLTTYSRELKQAIKVMVVPNKASRHNTPVRGDSVARMVKELNKLHQDDAAAISVRIYAFLPSVDDISKDSMALSVGCAIARSFPKYTAKTNKGTPLHVRVQFMATGYTIEPVVLQRIQHIADGVRDAAALVDRPPNDLHCGTYVDHATQMVKDLQSDAVSMEVIRGEDLKKQGYGGIYSVGMAAENPPALVVLKYRPKSPAGSIPHYAWVGKGIVYDTGGLSIKTSAFMPGMKRDMGGSAAICHAFAAAVKCKAEKNITALLCMAENSVDERSMRPDDVITLKSGKTCEVNNTDAEGRLVLADGVNYASKMDPVPNVICDMATLTGASGITCGHLHACVMSNSERLEKKVVKAGRECGDLTHPILYAPEVLNAEFNSVVADFKNSVKDRSNAQASCAGHFVGRNIADEYAGEWLHIDMAFPSHTKYDERATGYGVALLMQTFVL